MGETLLRISPDLALPIDAVTGTFGILATKGAGKSNAAVVMAEEMWDVGVPWVAIDPKGDWHGIRSSSDGKKPGLSVPVLGGRYGDVPIGPTEGSAWADVVLRHRMTCVIDVSQFTKADTVRFLLAFGTHLFRHADDDGAEPLHLFLEEAHEYLPQQVSGDVSNLVVALTDAGAALAQPAADIATTEELLDVLEGRLGKPKGAILRVLVDVYPEALTREQLAELVDVSPQSSGFEKNIGSLRSLGLVEYPLKGSVAALPILFLGGR